MPRRAVCRGVDTRYYRSKRYIRLVYLRKAVNAGGREPEGLSLSYTRKGSFFSFFNLALWGPVGASCRWVCPEGP